MVMTKIPCFAFSFALIIRIYKNNVKDLSGLNCARIIYLRVLDSVIIKINLWGSLPFFWLNETLDKSLVRNCRVFFPNLYRIIQAAILKIVKKIPLKPTYLYLETENYAFSLCVKYDRRQHVGQHVCLKVFLYK